MNYYDTYLSPLGKITIVSDGKSLIGLYFENQKYFMNNVGPILESKNDTILSKTRTWLDEYFGGKKVSPHILNLNPKGTDFQKMVWQELLTISYGTVTTYGELTKKIEQKLNRRMSSQAVASAIAHNPISIIIPCHRIIGKNNHLVGYAGGLHRKRALLQIEGINIK